MPDSKIKAADSTLKTKSSTKKVIGSKANVKSNRCSTGACSIKKVSIKRKLCVTKTSCKPKTSKRKSKQCCSGGGSSSCSYTSSDCSTCDTYCSTSNHCTSCDTLGKNF